MHLLTSTDQDLISVLRHQSVTKVIYHRTLTSEFLLATALCFSNWQYAIVIIRRPNTQEYILHVDVAKPLVY